MSRLNLFQARLSVAPIALLGEQAKVVHDAPESPFTVIGFTDCQEKTPFKIVLFFVLFH